MRAVRTQEEIVAQLEARYAEMEAEMQKPHRKWPCRACRHFEWKWANIQEGALCRHPLVTGLDRVEFCAWDEKPTYLSRKADLCGPEKALWEPTPPTRWQRLLEWLGQTKQIVIQSRTNR